MNAPWTSIASRCAYNGPRTAMNLPMCRYAYIVVFLGRSSGSRSCCCQNRFSSFSEKGKIQGRYRRTSRPGLSWAIGGDCGGVKIARGIFFQLWRNSSTNATAPLTAVSRSFLCSIYTIPSTIIIVIISIIDDTRPMLPLSRIIVDHYFADVFWAKRRILPVRSHCRFCGSVLSLFFEWHFGRPCRPNFWCPR
jgi:hypothetical protein